VTIFAMSGASVRAPTSANGFIACQMASAGSLLNATKVFSPGLGRSSPKGTFHGSIELWLIMKRAGVPNVFDPISARIPHEWPIILAAEAERKELAELVAEMSYDFSTKTWSADRDKAKAPSCTRQEKPDILRTGQSAGRALVRLAAIWLSDQCDRVGRRL
jgi:hypothetical protein